MKEKMNELTRKAGFTGENYAWGENEVLVASGLVGARCHHQFKTYVRGAGFVIADEKTVGYGPGVASKEYLIKSK